MIIKQITRKIYFFSGRFFSSILKDRYGFVAPSIPIPESRNPSSSEVNGNKKRRKKKEPYRPPSSLDMTGKKIIHSNLPFDFRFSYTESNPNTKPIGLREPKYSPFGPGRVDRTWTGVCAPAVDPALKSVEGDVSNDAEKRMDEWQRKRKAILGELLSPAERAFLIEKCQKHRTKRQVNLGRDGLTHNMLNDIQNNWKHSEAVRIKCLGVPTVDMKNVCNQIEEKTGGLIIHRHGGQIILFRGRHYNPKKRPAIPLMLWKPHEPVYPRLIKTVIEGLTVDETKEMRKRGLAVPALTKLAKNGYYASLVPMVRDAFLTEELVRIDCKGLPATDYKKIGVKLRDLVPCILVTFQKEQIVVWRGKEYSSTARINSEEKSFPLSSNNNKSVESGGGKSLTDISTQRSEDESVLSDSEDSEMNSAIEEHGGELSRVPLMASFLQVCRGLQKKSLNFDFFRGFYMHTTRNLYIYIHNTRPLTVALVCAVRDRVNTHVFCGMYVNFLFFIIFVFFGGLGHLGRLHMHVKLINCKVVMRIKIF